VTPVVRTGSARRFLRAGILAVVGGKIAGADPEDHLRVASHDTIERFEIAVEIANGTEVHKGTWNRNSELSEP
jgi:hypothetical protein